MATRLSPFIKKNDDKTDLALCGPVPAKGPCWTSFKCFSLAPVPAQSPQCLGGRDLWARRRLFFVCADSHWSLPLPALRSLLLPTEVRVSHWVSSCSTSSHPSPRIPALTPPTTLGESEGATHSDDIASSYSKYGQKVDHCYLRLIYDKWRVAKVCLLDVLDSARN